VAAAIAPSRISGLARPSLRFHTANSCPAASNRSAIGVPILPNPKNPILMPQSFLERFHNSHALADFMRGGFFLRKKPLGSNGFEVQQLWNRSSLNTVHLSILIACLM
jgi:hypothetical protein